MSFLIHLFFLFPCRDCAPLEPEDFAKDDEMAQKLWDFSMEACGLEQAEGKSLKEEASS